jgi:hypothetical protein
LVQLNLTERRYAKQTGVADVWILFPIRKGFCGGEGSSRASLYLILQYEKEVYYYSILPLPAVSFSSLSKKKKGFM